MDRDALGVDRAQVAVGEKVDEAASNDLGFVSLSSSTRSENREAVLVFGCFLQRLES